MCFDITTVVGWRENVISDHVFVQNGSDTSSEGNLMTDLEDALSRQRPNYMSGVGLTKQREERLQSKIQHRITELEGYRSFSKLNFKLLFYKSVIDLK